jgi:hypothetical protein
VLEAFEDEVCRQGRKLWERSSDIVLRSGRTNSK